MSAPNYKLGNQVRSVQSQTLDLLVCPRDKQDLRHEGTHLVCDQGHRYAVIEDVRILLVSEAEQTHIEGTRALAVAESGDASTLPRFNVGADEIDPFVRNAIGATNGGSINTWWEI